jgi:purine-binding chemotaxis protein CheW
MTAEIVERRPGSSPDVDAELEDHGSDIRQFVTFLVGDEVFAVDMAPVQEIIRMPNVVRVPLAPRTLDGMANLRGRLLPIISLRRLFNFDERPYEDSTRAVVIDIGQPLGFVVDRVASVVGVDPRQIEDAGTINATVSTKLISGVLKKVGGHEIIMVLDFNRVIASEFADLGANSHSTTGPALQSQAPHEDEVEEASDELQLVSFVVAQQEYAIAIEAVQEIVQIPAQIVHVPHANSRVLGVMTLRNRLLPLVSLRRMFGLPPQDADERSRVVVVSLGSASVGVVMDSVNEVLRVARTAVDEMPRLLAKGSDMSEIAQICKLDNGKRLVSVLSVDSLFRDSAIDQALTTVKQMNAEREVVTEARQDDRSSEDEEQLIVFRLGKEEFGVPIGSVQEIVRVADELTHVPKAPAVVEGVINLRGAILPVIDMRRRLALEQVERSDAQRIIVLLIEGTRTGFIVDSVAEVLKIPKSTIEAAPRLSGNQTKLLARMANLEKEKRMVQLIDPAHLIEKRELQGLVELAAA